MTFKKQFFLIGVLFAIFGLQTLSAQSPLQRISITERSDGNGYVIRYHLTEMVNSYELIQPEVDRIQMQLFSPNLTPDNVIMPEVNSEITGIEIIAVNGGIGLDITTAEGVFFKALSYPDQNLHDLLLTLEYTSQQEARQLAGASQPYGWSVPEEPAQQVVEKQPTETREEAPPKPEREARVRQTRNQTKVKFGFAGGVGIANKVGGGYTSDPRKGMTMGIAASVGLPYILFDNTETAIETGIFYTQKGFENPSTDKIDALTVVLDYIELPVLGKLSYPMDDMIKPHVLAGVYMAYRTAAEAVSENGDRGDLTDVTSSFDWGLSAGIGSDFVTDKATVSLQLKYSIGIPKMFNEGYSGGERPGFLSLSAGFKF